MREDVYSDDQEMDPEVQLHRHALYIAEKGDIVVVDARGDLRSGVFGEMMLTYFQGKGGEGIMLNNLDVYNDFFGRIGNNYTPNEICAEYTEIYYFEGLSNEPNILSSDAYNMFKKFNLTNL